MDRRSDRQGRLVRPGREGRFRIAGRRWKGGLAALGLAVAIPVHAQPMHVHVTPEPIGLARQLVATRGDAAPPELDFSDPGSLGLVLAAPAPPGTTSRATTFQRLDLLRAEQKTTTISDPRFTTSTTYQLMQASGAYAPTSTQTTRLDGAFSGGIVDDSRLRLQDSGFTSGGSGGTSGTLGAGSSSGQPPPPPVAQDEAANAVDLYAAHMQNLELLQARERRRQLEREQQQRVFELLQGKVQEIAELRAERQKATQARIESMRDIRGPSALAAINLFEGLYVDRSVNLHQSEILHIDHHVYQDANPETGLFYFAPKRYDLQWDPQNQYAMTVIYGMAGQRESEGEVYMATRLQAGVDLAELRLAEDLLLAYLRRNAGDGNTRFRELRPLPLAASSDVELFGGAQNQFTVPPEKISVQGITSLLDSMDVSWATDVRRLLNVESLLRTDANIHGSITMHASGEERLSRAIPLEIAVASHESFGRIPFDRLHGWQNRTRYPMRLQALHALMLAPEDGNGIRKDQPVVMSWDLRDTIVPPGATLSWDSSRVPPWVEQRAKALWVKYDVDGSCAVCDDQVFTERFIPPPPSTRQIVFTTGDAFESTGAYQIRVHVRSPFLDPQRNRILVSPAVLLEQDGAEVPIARLFLTDREMNGEGAHEPFYEFRIEVVMLDGEVHQSGWQQSRTLDYLLGSSSLRKVLGHLPGESAEVPAS